MKTCSKCKVSKELSEFGKNKNKKDNLNIWCKLCVSINDKERRKLYREKNKNQNKKWRLNNHIFKKEYDKIYCKKNKIKKNEYDKKYRIHKYKNNPNFKLKALILSAIHHSLKNNNLKKTKRTEKILGCTIEQFKQHLEQQFSDWMNWNNHGKYNGDFNHGWDLDHKIPISSVNVREDVEKLNHYTNFQPLDSKINRFIKRNKIQYD